MPIQGFFIILLNESILKEAKGQIIMNFRGKMIRSSVVILYLLIGLEIFIMIIKIE